MTNGNIIFHVLLIKGRGKMLHFPSNSFFFTTKLEKQKSINPYSHWVLSDNLYTLNVTPV